MVGGAGEAKVVVLDTVVVVEGMLVVDDDGVVVGVVVVVGGLHVTSKVNPAENTPSAPSLTETSIGPVVVKVNPAALNDSVSTLVNVTEPTRMSLSGWFDELF